MLNLIIEIQLWIYENFRPVPGLSEEEKNHFILMARREPPIETRMIMQGGPSGTPLRPI
jgi:hypothetical protein